MQGQYQATKLPPPHPDAPIPYELIDPDEPLPIVILDCEDREEREERAEEGHKGTGSGMDNGHRIPD